MANTGDPGPGPGDSGGMDRQLQLFRAGRAGEAPPLPVRYEALKERAAEELPPVARDFLLGGAGSESTMAENRRALERWRIVPRMLRDVTRRDHSVDLLGRRLPIPLLLAPLGVQGILHPDAELATARAARATGVPMVLSTVSSTPLEDVAETLGDVPKWFQLYWPRDPALAESLVRRADAAGFDAIVLTLDASFLGWRERDLEHGYLPFLYAEGLGNYFSDPVFRAGLSSTPEDDPAGALARVSEVFAHASLTWESLGALRKWTDLPIVLKGILDPADARRAVDAGVEGIVVSNHGGRQVDGAIGALDALPAVVEAVDAALPVLFDSGIRRGADLFRALALGAAAGLVGRPYALGLAAAGESGIRWVLENLRADFDLTMALAGCASPGEIERACVRESPAYRSS